MSLKLNCWEYRNCGMEPGGIFAKIYGACPVPAMMKLDGVNGGRGAGRACWIAINDASAPRPSVCRSSRLSCHSCEFFKRVHCEEAVGIKQAVEDVTSDQTNMVCS